MTLLAVSLAIGAFVSLIIWQTWLVFHEVPGEDRQYLDRPAIGFRLIWPLIRLVEHYLVVLLSEAYLAKVGLRLRTAGVEYSLTAGQFVAASSICAAAAWLVIHAFLGSVNHPNELVSILAAIGGYFYPVTWLRRTVRQRRAEIVQSLPFYLDVVTLTVEAGSNLTSGLTQVVRKTADSPLRREFARVLREIRAGKGRADALRDLAERTGSTAIQQVVSCVIQSDRTGASLGPLLRAQSEQLRSERFQRAEKRAMEAPVKLLAPLLTFIFPTTFLILIFLGVSKSIQEGVLGWLPAPVLWAYWFPAN